MIQTHTSEFNPKSFGKLARVFPRRNKSFQRLAFYSLIVARLQRWWNVVEIDLQLVAEIPRENDLNTGITGLTDV